MGEEKVKGILERMMSEIYMHSMRSPLPPLPCDPSGAKSISWPVSKVLDFFRGVYNVQVCISRCGW